MKFRYYLVEEDSTITGTDDKATALRAADSIGDNGFFAVIDSELGLDLIDKVTILIKEQTTFVIAHNPDVD